jgi:hypothetical protein
MSITPRGNQTTALLLQPTWTNLGVIQLTGPLDLSQAQGELQLLAHAIDPALLKSSASTGLDFALLQSTSRIQFARAAQKSPGGRP